MNLLVTGGAGFIGSAVVRHFVRKKVNVVNVDKLTYAGNLASLEDVVSAPNYVFERVDICQFKGLSRVFAAHKPDAVIHLAAETHVDRSISSAEQFVRTNVNGAYTLLEAARRYWEGLVGEQRATFRLLHVSTDEVYGSAGSGGSSSEAAPYAPSSPYAASKAAADHLMHAWFRTYGLPIVVTHGSNNFGPYQYPEKLVPLTILHAMEGRPLPVYGDGRNVRDWLYVEDHVAALDLILHDGVPGERYNIGSGCEVATIDVVRTICRIMGEMAPKGEDYENLITFVEDRPGHDFRYSMDCSKIRRRLGWRPKVGFEEGLARTVSWYLQHGRWWDGGWRSAGLTRRSA